MMEYAQMEQSNEKPTRRERKKARKNLAALLRRVRRSCKSVGQVSDWYKLARDVEAVVNDNSTAIPAGQRRRLLEALKLPEATMAGVEQACGVLQSELGKTIAALGGATSLAGVASAVVLLTAVVVMAVAVAASRNAVDVHIINHGCGPFDDAQGPLADSALLSLAGLGLLPQVIINGGNGVIQVPPLQFEVDNVTNPDRLSIRGPGQVLLVPILLREATDVRFNGRSLLGTRRIIDLAGADEHVLEVICSG